MHRNLILVAILVAAAPVAQAQDVHQEIVQRLDRIERLLRAGSGGGGSGEGVRMVVNFECSPGNTCTSIAKSQCIQAGFSTGVVSRAGPPQYNFVRATEVTCVR